MADFWGCRGFAADSTRETDKSPDTGPIGGLAELQIGLIAITISSVRANDWSNKINEIVTFIAPILLNTDKGCFDLLRMNRLGPSSHAEKLHRLLNHGELWYLR